MKNDNWVVIRLLSFMLLAHLTLWGIFTYREPLRELDQRGVRDKPFEVQ